MLKKIIAVIIVGFILFLMGLGIYEKQSGILSSDGRKSILQDLAYEVDILPDGSAVVNEYRTYEFIEGYFSRGFLDIEGIVDQVMVYEEDEAYTKLDNIRSDRPKGYFAVETKNDKTHVEWYYSISDRQTKTFMIQYKVPQTATLYNDCVDYFHKYVSSDNVYKIKNLSIIVHLPEGANSDNTNIWAHGPVGGYIDFEDDKTVKLEMKNVPPGRYIEARFLMPIDVMAPTDQKVQVDRFNELYEMETKALEKREAEGRFNAIISLVYITFSGIIIFLPIMSIIKYRIKIKKLKPELSPDYYRDIPTDIYPAELDYLMNHYTRKENTSLQISSTLLDLIHKGMINAEIVENKGVFTKKEDTAFTFVTQKNTAKHEHALLEFLFNKVGEGKTYITLNDVKKYCKDRKTANTAYKFYLDFKSKVESQVIKRQYFEGKRNAHPKSFKRYLIIYILLMIIPMILMSKVDILANTPIYYISISSFIGFMIIAIGSRVKRLLTQLGENQFALWKAFKNFLSDFTTFEQKELPELFMWEKYLVYATVLNVSQKLLKQLFARYPEIIEANQDTRLFYLLNDSNYQYAYDRLSVINVAMNDAMRDSINFVTRSSSKSGSGFSSGGSDAGDGAGGSSGGVD